MSTPLQYITPGLQIYRGLASSRPAGDVSAAANLAKLGTNPNLNFGLSPDTASAINTGATGALDALSVMQGLQRGGIGGYGQALGGGLQGLGLLTANPALTTAGGYVLAPLSVYNAIKNWQSGATGSDALLGMGAGASIGSIVPGLGTALGALIGGGVGALSSAFGGGKRDPETGQWNQYTQAINQLTPQQQAQVASSISPSQAYQNLAGVMSAKNLGTAQPIEQVFGRMGEQNLMDQLTQQINKGVQSGQITPGESVADQWTKTLNPWLTSKGVTWNPNQRTSTGQLETPALQQDIQSLIGQYESGQLTPQSQVGISGQTIGGMNPFAGWGGQAPTAQPQAAPAATPMTVAPRIGEVTRGFSPVMSRMAEGGSMSGLDHIYRGRFADRQHFQDGGTAYGSYYGGNPSASVFSPATQASFNMPTPDTSSTGPMPSAANLPSTQGDIVTLPDGTQFDVTTGLTFDPYTNQVTDPTGDGSTPTPGAPQTAGQALSTLLKNLTGQGNQGFSGILKTLGALAPLAGLAGLGRAGQANVTPPQAAPGMTQGATAPRAPMFNRTQVAAPSNLPGGAPMSLQDWYTYGSRPEAQFFQNNAMPMAQMTGVGPSYNAPAAASPAPMAPTTGTGPVGIGPIRPQVRARGGSALDSIGPEFHSSQQSFAQGPGTGTSDEIPAQLSDGEYVMDANTVSLLGNGSNKAGAARLDALRSNLRRSAAKPMAKGKQFMQAKPPAAYMAKKARRP
jgi:hypothetical protein